MKKVVMKILRSIFSTKNEKKVLIFLPLLAIVIALCVLIPSVLGLIRAAYADRDSYFISSADFQISSVIHTPPMPRVTTEVLPTEEPVPSVISENQLPLFLTATSGEKDLYIFIRDENGVPVKDNVFSVNVQYPGGQIGTYDSQSDGSCYLINLPAGDYYISLHEKNGFRLPEPISCHVNDTIAYTYIENIDEIVEIKDVSKLSNEIESGTAESPQIAVPEVLPSFTPSSDGIPLLDANGAPVYTYEYSMDADGYLLDTSGNSTGILPYEEEPGKLLWGLKLSDDGMTYVDVPLFGSDNAPLAPFAITATPVMTYSGDDGFTGWKNDNGKLTYLLNGVHTEGFKSIDSKLYYFDSSGIKAEKIGIDVSFYNGNINWNAVKNSGVDFVMVRIGGRGWSTGGLYDDSCFYNYLNGARAAGLKVGCYFYSAAVNRVEAVQEASICIDRLNGVNLDMPIFIDMEYSGDYPEGRADTLAGAQRTEIIRAFCETIKNSGYQSGIYTSQSMLSGAIDYSSVQDYTIWMASYTENNQLPSMKARYDIWQFSDRGRIPGISGNVDVNVIF